MYNAKLNDKWIFICALLFIACTEQYTSLRMGIQSIDPAMPSEGTYVIIPNQGCDGCISQAEDFVRKHITSAPQVRYIFTRIQSTKLLSIKLGSTVMSSKRVLLDSSNVIVYPDRKNNIYPMIVTISDHKISGITYQSPDLEGLSGVLKDQ
jgi:hypothetical protein